MFSIAVIIFREVLEISLILSVLLAATRGLPKRGKFIWSGLFLGVLGSALVACFAEGISTFARGMGQELFNAGILLSAALLIGWTVVWMRRHARDLTQHLKEVGQSVLKGNMPLYSLTVVIALAMLREGSEIVLFTYGVLASGESVMAILTGSSLGLLIGSAVGFAFYYGLIKISPRSIFSVTSWMLIFVAAGMASQGAKLLAAGGFIPEFGTAIWDTSMILAETSLIGNFLHILVGYSERPSGAQFLAYLLTFFTITIVLKLYGTTPNQAGRLKHV